MTKIDRRILKSQEAIKKAFIEHPHWCTRDADQRELRKKVYSAILKIDLEIDMDKAKSFVDIMFTHLNEANKK